MKTLAIDLTAEDIKNVCLALDFFMEEFEDSDLDYKSIYETAKSINQQLFNHREALSDLRNNPVQEM